MNLFVYTGRFRKVEVGTQTFERGKPVPVSSRTARQLERSSEFERYEKPADPAPQPDPDPEPVVDSEPQEAASSFGGLFNLSGKRED